MSERGVFAVDRGIWEHDVLSDNEPFSRREAWLWLLSEAAWKPHKRRVIGRTVELSRGQYVGSLRFIASKWRWSEPRVRRFLGALISSEMVDAKTDAGVTVVTICKYDEYQRVSLPSDATPKVDVEAAPTQERRKVEDKEDKEYSVAKATGAVAPLDPAVPEREYFLRGREVLGKGSGALIAKLLKAKGGNVAYARAALEQASQKQNPTEYIGAVCRGPPASKPLTAHQQERETGREILNALRDASSRTDSEFLRHDTGNGPEGLRGGVRGALIDLSSTRDRAGHEPVERSGAAGQLSQPGKVSGAP
jgi:hypothetical protein